MRISDWSSDVCSSDLNLDDHDSAYDDDHVALLFTIRFFELLREVTNCPPDRRNMDIAITPKLGDFIDRGSRFLDEISHVCPQRNRRPVVSFAVARTNPTPIPTAKAERSEENTSDLQSLMRNSYADFCFKKKTQTHHTTYNQSA